MLKIDSFYCRRQEKFVEHVCDNNIIFHRSHTCSKTVTSTWLVSFGLILF